MIRNLNKKRNKGFTLVELMASVSVFAIVMVISMGSIITIFDANKKTQTLRVVMDNLNFSIESMTRTIRFGTRYHCDVTQGITSEPRDCIAGASSIMVLDSGGRSVSYRLTSNRITRSINGSPEYYITSSDVNITNLTFRVIGSTSYSTGSDTFQPQVIITISGFSGTKPTSRSSFTLQTTVSQRQFDSL